MSVAVCLDKDCPVCGGEMTQRDADICCREEDDYLLCELRSYVRSITGRAAALGVIMEHLYERLQPFLTERKIDLNEIDPGDVFVELEKRILRAAA